MLKYLARYVVGSAINDQRIISDDGQHVTIRAKDYRTGNVGPLSLTGEEFVRRYLLHILPHGLPRVRYCGLFSVRHREQTLSHCRALLGVADETPPSHEDQTSSEEFDPAAAQRDDTLHAPSCPRCLMPNMQSLGRLTAEQTYRLLDRLTLLGQSVATVLVTLPLARPSHSSSFPLPLSTDVLVWSVTTLEIDFTTSDRSDLPKPDT